MNYADYLRMENAAAALVSLLAALKIKSAQEVLLSKGPRIQNYAERYVSKIQGNGK